MMKGCCFTIIFFFVAFFLFTPTSFINLVADLLPAFIGDLIGKYLPSLLFIVYMSVIIPMIIRLLVKTEKHHTIGSSENSTMNKFLIFFSMNVFLFPTIVTPIIDTVIYGGDFGSDFAHAVADMGNFFLIYLTTMLFIQNGFNLLQVGRLIGSKLAERDATTRREEILAWSNVPFDVSYNSATHLTVMIVAFSYVVTAPLCCIVGALYYNLRYFIDKYNICCLFYIPFESRGETPKSALRFVILTVCMFQLLSSLILMSINRPFLIIGAALALVAVIICIILLCFEDRFYRDETRVFSTETSEATAMGEEYLYPTEKAGDLKADLDTSRAKE